MFVHVHVGKSFVKTSVVRGHQRILNGHQTTFSHFTQVKTNKMDCLTEIMFDNVNHLIECQGFVMERVLRYLTIVLQISYANIE